MLVSTDRVLHLLERKTTKQEKFIGQFARSCENAHESCGHFIVSAMRVAGLRDHTPIPHMVEDGDAQRYQHLDRLAGSAPTAPHELAARRAS